MIIFTDIHGNFNTFIALLDKIPQSEKDKGVIIAGDLVDRGPNSMQMVQYCIDNNIAVVMGNHEDMMIREALEEAEHYNKNKEFNWRSNYSHNPNMAHRNIWGINGGYVALASYFDKDKNINMELLKSHIEWMKKLPIYLEYKDLKNKNGEHLLVTHSSANRVWRWDKNRREEHKIAFESHLMWGRPTTIKPIKGIFNIFGHTPVPNGPKIKSCYANIDTGCFYESEGYFKLTAIQFPEMVVYQHDNIDKNNIYHQG